MQASDGAEVTVVHVEPGILPIPLNDDERIEAKIIEARIEGNLKKLNSVWESILEDLALYDAKKLWRESYASFGDWWRDRFPRSVLREFFSESSDRYKNYQVKALEVVADVLPAGSEFTPKLERHARELLTLETPSERRTAAKLAHDVGNGSPVANDFKSAARAVKRGLPEFEVGQTAYLDNGSEDSGAPMTITKVGMGSGGNLVYACNEKTGVEQPFTVLELSHADPSEEAEEVPVEVVPRKEARPTNIDLLSFEATMAREEADELRRRLLKLIEAIEAIKNAPTSEREERTSVAYEMAMNSKDWLGVTL